MARGEHPSILDTPIMRLRARLVGPRGVLLGLHHVPGVLACKVVDYGQNGVTMPMGTAHVDVWGGDPVAVFEAMNRFRGVMITTTVYPPRWWHRLRSWWIRL
jgi:hypothetical protein